MSTLLKVRPGNGSLLHMTSDTKTEAAMDSDPVSTTIFHSDLPYILIRERWKIDTYYTDRNCRIFDIPVAMKTFKTNNPDLAYLVVLTDSLGNRWIHHPMPHSYLQWVKFYCSDQYEICGSGGWRTMDFGPALLGDSYHLSFIDDLTLLDGGVTGNGANPIAMTFRTWDVADNYIAVSQEPVVNTNSPYRYWFYPQLSDDYTDTLLWGYVDYLEFGGGKIRNINGIDVTELEVLFLNVTNSSSAFEVQKDFINDDILITPDDFIVNHINLNTFSPLVSHGIKATNDIITPLTTGGIIVGSKVVDLNFNPGKVDSANKLINGNAPVVEIPAEIVGSGWDIDFSTQSIQRDGKDFINAAMVQKSMYVAGSATLEFTPNFTITPGTDVNTHSFTETGNIGAVNANTIYLASIVLENGQKLTSILTMAPGDNLFFYLVYGYRNNEDPIHYYTSNIKFYLNISNTGTFTIYIEDDEGNSSVGNHFHSVVSAGISLQTMYIRLISLVSSSDL